MSAKKCAAATPNTPGRKTQGKLRLIDKSTTKSLHFSQRLRQKSGLLGTNSTCYFLNYKFQFVKAPIGFVIQERRKEMCTRKMLKTSAAMACVLALTLLNAACDRKTSGSTAETSGQNYTAPAADAARKTTANSDGRYPKVVVGINMDPQNLLPYDVNAGTKPQIYHNFYEGLFDMEGSEYIPVLAKGYEVIDPLHYDVEIYDYIYDHAGNQITADDVVFSYRVLIDSGYNFKYASFANIEKISDYKLRFTWTSPIVGVGDLEFPFCKTIVFSQKAYEGGNFAVQPIATGPYKVTRFVSGSTVVLEAVDNYWQKDKSKISRRHEANVQTIQYDVITESSQHVIALKSNTIDFSEMVPAENRSEFENSRDFGVYVVPGSGLYTLNINTAQGHPGNDINFRLAVYYAINNEACAQATSGTTLPAKAFGSAFFPDYVVAWDTTPTYINTYNPELAKEYLAKSNYKGETLKLLGENNEIFKNLMTIIQSFLTNTGIKVEISATLTANEIDSPPAWDLVMNRLGGGMQIGQWNRVLNYNEFASNTSMGFIHDETLQQKFDLTKNVANHGDQAMTDLHNYFVERAYEYAVATGLLSMVYNNAIAEVYLREKQYFLPGACIYYLDN
jgi:ABC-type transport system substrate-binding protein